MLSIIASKKKYGFSFNRDLLARGMLLSWIRVVIADHMNKFIPII